jgi:transcription initiation factor TFIID subunit 10
MAESTPPQTQGGDGTNEQVDVDMEGMQTQANADTQMAEREQVDYRAEKEALELGLKEAGLDEARVPSRKDVSLREFLSKMDDYAPIVSLILSLDGSSSDYS